MYPGTYLLQSPCARSKSTYSSTDCAGGAVRGHPTPAQSESMGHLSCSPLVRGGLSREKCASF